MKRILLLAAGLSIPTIAIADSVSWSTYCDGNVEKVRCSLTLSLPGALSVSTAEMTALNNETCNLDAGGCGNHSDATGESVGSGDYLYVIEGWPRACLALNQPSFYGQVFYYAADPGQPPVLRLREFFCNQFEPALIVDNSDCSTLPVASKTWGSIKVMYR